MDLDKLSRAEKIRLYDLIQEKKRRIRQAGAIYQPNKGQLPVHQSKASLRCVFSGNGAGKTALAVNEALSFALGFNTWTKEFTKVPARVIVLLDHPSKVGDVWVPELQKWTTLTEDQLHKRGKPYVEKISFKNGSEIIFMFHESSPLLFESIELDAAIFDEPPPRAAYIALRRGGRKKGRKPKFLIIGTPISAAWMRTEISEPWSKGELPDTECFTFGTVVNESNLAAGYIQSFSQALSEKERRIRLHGEFFDLEGLALAHLFDPTVHIVEPFEWPHSNPVVVAIDPHPVKAHYAVMLGTDREGSLYYIKEIRLKAVARDFALALKDFVKGYRVIDYICDSLGSAEMTGGEGFRTFIQVLKDNGIQVRSTDWSEKSDEDFIERIRSALVVPTEPDNYGLYLPKLRIFRGNYGIVGDIENVQWVKWRNLDEYKPKLEITHKDYLSCLKYALATNLSFGKEKAKIYRHIHGAETYGVRKVAPRSMRMTLKNLKTKAKADRDW